MTSVSVVVRSSTPRRIRSVAQLRAVVDLAVVDDVKAPVGRGHGHDPARLEIDDRQPAGGNAHARSVVLAVAVRTAMLERVAHVRRQSPGARSFPFRTTAPAMPHIAGIISGALGSSVA